MSEVKEWLIRTSDHFILGPLLRDKLIELIESGRLKDDDEICRGNGFWLFLREKELLKKYLYDNIPSGFNPINEAEPLNVHEKFDRFDGEFKSESSAELQTQIIQLDALRGNTTRSKK
jgi:hypothetical protein